MKIKISTPPSNAVQATEEYEMEDILDTRRTIKSFCEKVGVDKCNFEIIGSAELRDVDKDRENGVLYCYFG